MLTIRWGAVAHQFLGVALALPPLGLTWVFAMSWRAQEDASLGVAALAGLAAVAVIVIGAVACAPPVRGVEVAAARTLLNLDLPDPLAPAAWPPRLLGAAWLAVVATLGAVVGFAVLYLVPLAAGLVIVPVLGADFRIPGLAPSWHADPGVSSLGWAGLGVVALAAAYAVLAAGAAATRGLAPRFLGPTSADAQVHARERERRLARTNLLARELHDSVGHALTAMTIQADAARVLLRRDPAAAEAALDALADRGRDALAGLDGVLGALRAGTDPTPGGDLLATVLADVRAAADVQASGTELLSRLPGEVAGDVARILAEAVTNGRRHGVGPLVVLVAEEAEPLALLRLRVENAVPDRTAVTTGAGTGRGLLGVRERALLLGATVHAGPARDHLGRPCWVLDLEVPR